MSQTNDNVDALRPIYDSWGEGDWRAGPEVYGRGMVWAWSQFLAAGDRVVVFTRYRGSGRGGIELDRAAAHVWTMREGKAARLDVFIDRRLALGSAGLDDAD